MIIEEAIKVIRDKDARWEAKVEAAGWLTSSADTPLSYLVECLNIKGLPQEMAATKLYARTKRPRIGLSVSSIIMDPKDWSEYLEKTNMR